MSCDHSILLTDCIIVESTSKLGGQIDGLISLPTGISNIKPICKYLIGSRCAQNLSSYIRGTSYSSLKRTASL